MANTRRNPRPNEDITSQPEPEETNPRVTEENEPQPPEVVPREPPDNPPGGNTNTPTEGVSHQETPAETSGETIALSEAGETPAQYLARLKLELKIKELERRLDAYTTGIPLRTPETTAARDSEPAPQPESSATDPNARAPSQRAMTDTYQGKSMSELRVFDTQLRNQFALHEGYFTNEKRKIGEAVRYLSGTLLLQWDQAEIPEPRTSKDLYNFLLHQITDPKKLTQEAGILYRTARQRREQSAREFSTYLKGQEAQLPEQFSENQRREQFRACIRPELRLKLDAFPDTSTTYEGFVSYVQHVEDNTRKTEEEARKLSQGNRGREMTRGNPRSSKPSGRDSWDNTSRKRNNDSKSKDNETPKGHKRKATYSEKCYSCQGIGHKAAQCPSAKDKSYVKKTERDSKN